MSRRIYVQFIEHKKDANPLIRVISNPNYRRLTKLCNTQVIEPEMIFVTST